MRTLEMPLVNCEINLILTWSEDWVIFSENGEKKLKIIDTKLYVPVVTLSTQNNVKLLEQLKSGLKRTINLNKYQTKVSGKGQNQYLDFLIDPSFQGVNSLFVLSFENEGDRKFYIGYYLPEVEKKKKITTLWLLEKAFSIRQLKLIWEHMIIFKKFQQVKKMITQLVVYWAILIAKNIMIAIGLSSRFK